MNQEQVSQKYQRAVEKCKLLYRQRNELKYEIVKMALSVCIIKEGNNGGHRLYTLSAFAKDVGIAYGTLSRWKMEYENVIIKVSEDQKNFKLDRHALEQTMRIVNNKTPKTKVLSIYKKYSTGYKTPEDKTLHCYVQRLRSMHYFICYGAVIGSLNKEDVKEMESYLAEMLDCIKKYKTKRTKKPVVVIKKAKEMNS